MHSDLPALQLACLAYEDGAGVISEHPECVSRADAAEEALGVSCECKPTPSPTVTRGPPHSASWRSSSSSVRVSPAASGGKQLACRPSGKESETSCTHAGQQQGAAELRSQGCHAPGSRLWQCQGSQPQERVLGTGCHGAAVPGRQPQSRWQEHQLPPAAGGLQEISGRWALLCVLEMTRLRPPPACAPAFHCEHILLKCQ